MRLLRPSSVLSLVVAAVVLTSVGAGWASQARASAYSVTAYASTTDIVLGKAVTVSGSVSPRAARAEVVLQARRSGSWTRLRSTTTDSAGAYRVTFRPAAAGAEVVRVCKAAAGARRAGCSAPVTIKVSRWQYLYDLDSADYDGVYKKDPLSINGHSYKKSLESTRTYSGTHFIEYNLARKCSRLRTTLGISDDSETGAEGQVEILGDGNQLLERAYALGQSEPVTVQTSGVLRVRIETTTDQDDISEYLGIGSPQVLCTF